MMTSVLAVYDHINDISFSNTQYSLVEITTCINKIFIAL